MIVTFNQYTSLKKSVSFGNSVVDYIIFSPAAELHLITSTFDPSPS